MPAYKEKKSLKDILAEKLGKSKICEAIPLRVEEPKKVESFEQEETQIEIEDSDEEDNDIFPSSLQKTSFKDLLDEVKEEIEEEEFQEFALEVEQTVFNRDEF